MIKFIFIANIVLLVSVQRFTLSQDVCCYDMVHAIRYPAEETSTYVLPTVTQNISPTANVITQTEILTDTQTITQNETVISTLLSSIYKTLVCTKSQSIVTSVPPVISKIITKTCIDYQPVVSVITNSLYSTITQSDLSTCIVTSVSSQFGTISIQVPVLKAYTMTRSVTSEVTVTSPELFVLTSTMTCTKNLISTISVPMETTCSVKPSTHTSHQESKCFLVHPDGKY